MYGNVIENGKKNKNVPDAKEQITKQVDKSEKNPFERHDYLNKNTKSCSEHLHRRHTFYRQYTLQNNKNCEKTIPRISITKGGEKILILKNSDSSYKHYDVERESEICGDISTSPKTDTSIESQNFHSVFDLTDSGDINDDKTEIKLVHEKSFGFFSDDFFSGGNVHSDYQNRKLFNSYKENLLKTNCDVDHGDSKCLDSKKKSNTTEQGQKTTFDNDTANDEDNTVGSTESNSETFQSSGSFETIGGDQPLSGDDQEQISQDEKSYVSGNISNFLNELKLHDNDNYDLVETHHGFIGITDNKYARSMAHSESPTKDGNQKVTPRRRMTVGSDENPASRDNKYHLKERLCDYVLHDIIGSEQRFRGPWGAMPLTYLDYVASGRPLRCLEDYIREHVMPTYANTHTEVSFTATQTGMFREEARAVIKASVNASDDDVVIFTGSGSTSAVNKLVHVLKPSRPLVLVGPYEHHSNILPWTEIKGANVIRIQSTKDGLLDLDHLEWELKKGCFHKREVIGSFSAASNVTGILTDVNAVCTLLHRHKGIALFDYACAAPYVDIDMNSKGRKDQDGLAYRDAVFISTHKFIGGPGTPGLLIAKKHLFRNKIPHNVGGGTVQFVRRSHVSYRIDIEEREEGGTPAIIESIRAGLVFKLKDTFTAKFIMIKEEELLRKAKLVWSAVPGLVLLGNLNAARLPIFPMLYYNHETGLFLHHDFVAMVLNDVFGIQVRSGCACAGPYAMDLIGLSEEVAIKYEKLTVWDGQETRDTIIAGFKPGFVRLNCPYFFTDETFNFVLKAIQMVATHAWKILYLYDFDPIAGKWKCKLRYRAQENKHLHDISFSSGHLEVKSDEKQNRQESINASEATIFQKLYQGDDAHSYVDILKRAQSILTPNKDLIAEYAKIMKRNTLEIYRHNLRWFMLPEDCVDLLSGKAVMYLPPEQLPFFPGSLGVKLGMSQEDLMKIKARRKLDVNFPVEATGNVFDDRGKH